MIQSLIILIFSYKDKIIFYQQKAWEEHSQAKNTNKPAIVAAHRPLEIAKCPQTPLRDQPVKSPIKKTQDNERKTRKGHQGDLGG